MRLGKPIVAFACLCLWVCPFAGPSDQQFQSFFDDYRKPVRDRWFVEEQLVKCKPPKDFLVRKLVFGARHEQLLAARVLDDLGDKESVPFLLFAYSISDQEMVIAVLEALRKLDLNECLKLARTVVDDKRVPIRGLVYEILAVNGTPEDWPQTVKGFEDGSPIVRGILLSHARPVNGNLWANREMHYFVLDSLRDPDKGVKLSLCRRLEKETDEAAKDLLYYLAYNEEDKNMRDHVLASLKSWYERNYRRIDRPHDGDALGPEGIPNVLLTGTCRSCGR